MDTSIYPLTFTPALRDYIWGGRRLETLFGRQLPPGPIAESWEISGHPTASTTADAGLWAGSALPQIQDALGERLVGHRAGWALARHKFPLLIKLLDAHQDLSIQVHPDDPYALIHEAGELGKTEMWYVLHADPGTELILGVQPGTTPAVLRQALVDGVLDQVVRRVPIAAGQAVAVPAGTLHALLAGAVVTEIQQNSDTTYRIYDWGRLGADGRPRPLHIDKGLDVIDFQAPAPGIVVPRPLAQADGMQQAELVHNRYFVVEEIKLAPGAFYEGVCDGATLEVWGCLSGAVAVRSDAAPVALEAVRYALLPAALGHFRITASQASTCLRAYLPPA